MEHVQPITSFLSDNWIALLLGGLWQCGVVWLTWRWQKDQVRLMALVVLAVFPVVVLVTRETSDIAFRLTRVEKELQADVNAPPAEALFQEISERNPEARERALTLYSNVLHELRMMANGRETISNETEFFSMMLHHLEHIEANSEVWNVVMPLLPSRIGPDGEPPLLKYLDRLETLVRERGIVYNLVALVSHETPEESESAAQSLAARGFNVYVVRRESLPEHLWENFSLFESVGVVLVAERGDDARVIRGVRIQADIGEVRRRKQQIEHLLTYAEMVGP